MDLGPYASYPLPARIKRAFGADTASELADKLGASGSLTPALAREAESAYNSWSAGDTAPARAFLSTRLGLDDATVDDVLAKLSAS
jgi:hypothetical protein